PSLTLSLSHSLTLPSHLSLSFFSLCLFHLHSYITSFETGNQPVTDIFHFIVYDGENNRLDNQMCTITITSVQRQPPVVTVHSGIKVTQTHRSSNTQYKHTIQTHS